MKKPVASILVIVGVLAVTALVLLQLGVFSDLYGDTTEYPLVNVDAGDSSDYLLVRTTYQASGQQAYEVITDTALIKENKDSFLIKNKSSIHGAAPEGIITVYKDQKELASVRFNSSDTKEIDYGTLESAFVPVNGLRCKLLSGAEPVQEDTYFTVVKEEDAAALYSVYVHGPDRESLSGVTLAGTSNETPDVRYISDTVVQILFTSGDSKEAYVFNINTLSLSMASTIVY